MCAFSAQGLCSTEHSSFFVCLFVDKEMSTLTETGQFVLVITPCGTRCRVIGLSDVDVFCLSVALST